MNAKLLSIPKNPTPFPEYSQGRVKIITIGQFRIYDIVNNANLFNQVLNND